MLKYLLVLMALGFLFAGGSTKAPTTDMAVRLQQRIDMCFAEYDDPVKCTATNMAP